MEESICQDCRESDNSQRTLWCIDCGEEFTVNIKDYMACRCEECQNEENKKNKRDWKRNNRERYLKK